MQRSCDIPLCGYLAMPLRRLDDTRVETAALRFDVDLLTQRLVGTIDWLGDGRPSAPAAGLAIGLFGEHRFGRSAGGRR